MKNRLVTISDRLANLIILGDQIKSFKEEAQKRVNIEVGKHQLVEIPTKKSAILANHWAPDQLEFVIQYLQVNQSMMH